MGANPQMFNIVNEAELSEVLSHYDTEYVIGVVDNALQNRFNPSSVVPQPNVVAAWEQNFKQIMAYYQYAEFITRIQAVRDETYKEIILRICKEFNLNFTIEDDVDWYSAAYFLYDFFVCNFNNYMIQFLSAYIYKERSGIYESMNLGELKKSKDSSTAYGKRIYKDIKLAVINANIDFVVQNIMGNDVSLGDIFMLTMPKDKVIYISSLVSPKEDFFKMVYGQVLASAVRPVILTEIRFALQSIAKAHDEYGHTEQMEENENA